MDLPPPPEPEAEEKEKKTPLPEFPALPKAEEHIPSEIPPIRPKAPEEPITPEKLVLPAKGEAPPKAPPVIAPPPEVRHEERKAPAEAPYINVATYQDVMDAHQRIKDQLVEAETLVEEMTSLKNLEEKELERWRATLEDIDRKVSYVDQVVAKGA